MLFLAKIKQHGIKKSYAIAKQKFSVLLKSSKIKLDYYSFLRSISLLNKTSQKLFYFTSNTILNKDIDFSFTSSSVESPGNDFFLLGKNYHFKNNINWHFNSNDISKSYPYEISNRFSILDFEKFGDYRITWELNRHHHFVWYAQNYYLTNNELWKEKFFSEINEWVEKNKVGFGINYVSPMEISIRLINWVVSFIIISSKSDIQNRINSELINNFLGQILYLNQNLFIKRKFRNNHSIVELAGLILIQSILNWNKLDNNKNLFQTLFDELNDQFYDDGINFEQSPTYTRFTLEALLVLLIFINNDDQSTQKEKLRTMVYKYIKTLRKFVTPDNSVPLFSDCDNGRILFLSGTNRDFNNFRGFFDFCGILFEDELLFVSKTNEDLNFETKWWCFLANKEPRVREPKTINENISFFPVGGYYIYNKEGTFFSFKSGYLGNKNLDDEYAPHAHNDLLSFELYFKNTPLIIDSGTYTYDLSDENFRDYFRSPYAHNTIIINSQNQIEHNEAFGARDLPQANINMITDQHTEGSFVVNNNVLINRSVVLNVDKIEFTDSIKGLRSESKVEINLNFHSDITLNIEDKDQNQITISSLTKKFKLEIIPSHEFSFFVRKDIGWISDYYNTKYKNEKLIITFPHVNKDINIRWLIKTNN